ncbi:MAG: peptidoglycan editing factor PgeF [Proteobacteria bacterium]|nr:peptidoglycan editing factor PgeF [Pseudomonadota bacterium]
MTTQHTPPYLTHSDFAPPHIAYGFFTRHGGVSQGGYASLNGGYGSGDSKAHIATNRQLATTALQLTHLVGLRQIHSAEVHTITPDNLNHPPTHTPPTLTGDGLVTNLAEIGLVILTADCAPVLFADPTHNIIGAAHAGWRGAVAGVTDQTIHAMCGLGATPATITAIIGPAIQRPSYQVGEDMRETVLAKDPTALPYFHPDNNAHNKPKGKYQFDLPAYISHRLKTLAIAHYALPHDTMADPSRFFSHRHSTLAGTANQAGRLINIIALKP